MKELSLIDYTHDFYSGISGLDVGKEIDRLIMTYPNQLITISMYGVPNVSPSFVNGAFLYVIDLYGVDYFRSYIKIIQISQKLLPQIKQSIDGHVQKKKSFYKQLVTNNVFVGIDGGRYSTQMREQIMEAALENNTHILWNTDFSNALTEDAKKSIERCDVFIGIWAVQSRQNIILPQANYAIQLGKPCLILCKKDLYIKIPEKIKNKVELVRFDDDNRLMTLRGLNKVILENQVRQPSRLPSQVAKPQGVLEVAGWAALGVAGAWLISELFKRE